MPCGGLRGGRGLTLPRHAQVAASAAIWDTYRRGGGWARPDVHTSTPSYPKRRGGICVSTVSIVGGCRDLLDPGWPKQSDSSRCRWHWRVASSCTYVTVFTDFFCSANWKIATLSCNMLLVASACQVASFSLLFASQKFAVPTWRTREI